jgi:hypothetical protein
MRIEPSLEEVRETPPLSYNQTHYNLSYRTSLQTWLVHKPGRQDRIPTTINYLTF